MTTDDETSPRADAPRKQKKSAETEPQTASALPILLVLLAFMGVLIIYGTYSN